MKPYLSKSGKKIFAHLNELDETFRFHLSRLAYSINEEDIHYLRRATKKLKALYKLFTCVDHRFNSKKRFSPVNEIFEPAGDLREMQVNQKVLKSYNVSQTLLNNYALFTEIKRKGCEKKLKKSIKKFNSGKHKKSLKKIEKICRKIDEEKLSYSVSAFVQERLKSVKDLFTVGMPENNLHPIRILIKSISPSLAIMDLSRNNNEIKKLIVVLKNTEDKLGFWHDRVMLYQSLHAMWQNEKKDAVIVEELESLLQKMKEEKTKLFNDALDLVNNTLKQNIEESAIFSNIA